MPASGGSTRLKVYASRMMIIARPAWHLLPVLLLAAAVLSPGLARAQIMAGPGLSGHNPGAEAEKPKPPPPEALPGARTDKERVAPPDRSTSDMSPNEALFDGINRGDIAAVRDAIDRGADLKGPNVLGLTPIELSIDLGRNDISFLLLSLRGSE